MTAVLVVCLCVCVCAQEGRDEEEGREGGWKGRGGREGGRKERGMDACTSQLTTKIPVM